MQKIHLAGPWASGTSAARQKFHRIYVAKGFDVDVDVDVDVDLDGDDDVDGDGCTVTKGGVLRATCGLGWPTRHHAEFPASGRLSACNRVLALVGDIVDELPKGHSARADQLVRTAESVVRNIAEGAGRWSGADSAKRYKIARGEAIECAASLDVMKLPETRLQRAI